ncbi:MAG: ATP-binding protein [Ardenticatenaceae bacterium]|nr:ATP-binding protein [Ardenticatenaceae bacterium]HBY95178.1 hypothetical protein [Chloroflexota bacterium]
MDAESANETAETNRLLAESYPLWTFQLLEEASSRLAARVSDGPGQLLANAIFELAACLQLMDERPDLAKEGLAALEEELRQGLRTTQKLVFELNPTLLNELGLIGTIRHYASRFQAETGLAVVLDSQFPPERLPGMLELVIFRIIQEALTNVRQHARASQVTIHLRASEDIFEVLIEDDGKGLDLNAVVSGRQRHLGLVSMHDRARLVGGSLQIGNRAQGGTRVLVTIPRSSHLLHHAV